MVNSSKNIVQVTESNIEKYLDQYPILFLDFFASWCGPCKTFMPIFEKVGVKNPDILFGFVDSEKEGVLSNDFEIRSVPTLVILKNKEIIYQESGSIPEYALHQIVTNARNFS